MSDISPVFEVADILWVLEDTSGFRSKKENRFIADIRSKWSIGPEACLSNKYLR
jgi:hypothetical protein